MNVGDRVKRIRRGCVPDYGTVTAAHDTEADVNGPATRWLTVAWDHGPTCDCAERELTPVKRDRSPHTRSRQ